MAFGSHRLHSFALGFIGEYRKLDGCPERSFFNLFLTLLTKILHDKFCFTTGFPKDASFMDNSQTESEEDETEEEDIEVDEEKPGSEAKKPPKRKAAAIVGKPKVV